MGLRTPRLAVALAASVILSGCGAKKLAKQAEQLMDDGRTTHASRMYRQACEKRPTKGAFQLGYARALIADGQADLAVDAARKALEADEDGARLVLIDALVRSGQVDEARQHIDAGLAAQPGDVAYLEAGAREHLVRGQPRQAVVAMKKVVEQDPSGPRQAYLAWLLARANEMPRAIEAAQSAFGTGMEDVEALGDVAAVFLLADMEPERKAAAREMQTFGVEIIDSWKERAGRAQQAGDEEGALRALTAAGAMRPDQGELRGLLGRMYLALEEYPRAVHFLESALVTSDYRDSWEQARAFDTANAVLTMGFENEEAAAFCVNLAHAHEAMGNVVQAGTSMRASLLIGGDNDPARWLEAASLFQRGGDLRAAAHAGHYAFDQNPRLPAASVFLMKLYLAAGDEHQAIGYGRVAWELLPGDPYIALTLGELYERRGDVRGARDIYIFALEQHPEVSQLRAAIQRIER